MEYVVLAIALAVIVSVVWPSWRGAPWVPSSRAMVKSMLSIADVGPDDVVYDLGCGDGRMITTAARRYGARAVGIEIDPLRYLWCQLLITVLGLRGRVRILFGNFFSKDLGQADVVTCYLMQDTNQKLITKFETELKFGARVVSNTFTFNGMHPVRENGGARLYVFFPPQSEPLQSQSDAENKA